MNPYRESLVVVPSRGEWRHPTYLENRVNGCHCTDCPGDWTGTGVEVAGCRKPCPARWWRRLVCWLRGRHRIVVHAGQVRCSTCLRIYENPSLPVVMQRVPRLVAAYDVVSVEPYLIAKGTVEACDYVFEDPVDGTPADCLHLDGCKRPHVPLPNCRATTCPGCGRIASGTRRTRVRCAHCRLTFTRI